MREPMSSALRTQVRWLWLAVQDHRCAVCGVGVAERYGHQARWVLDYQRTHDGGSCPKGGECVDCVQGTTCRLCMLQLTHVRQWAGYVPRSRVSGLEPGVWAARAAAYVSGDFRSLCGASQAGSDGGEGGA